MIRELNDLAKTTRKVNRDDRKGTTYIPGSKNALFMDDNNFENEKAYSKRKTLICLNENPEVMNKFEIIINSINNIVEIMYIILLICIVRINTLFIIKI